MAPSANSEDALSNTLDSCVADTIIKIGGGIATGALFSLFLFKRKSWPIVFGVGIGAGMGTSDCQYKLSLPYLVRASDQIKAQMGTMPNPNNVKDPTEIPL